MHRSISGFVAAVAVLSLGSSLALAQAKAPAKAPEAPRAAEPAKPDALTEKGFTRAGNLYSLAEETDLLNEIKALRITKRKADLESRQRMDAEKKIADNRKIITESIKEYESLERRMPNVRDEVAKNRMVVRMNLMVTKVNDAQAQEKELEEKANKISQEFKTKFVDDMAEIAPKVEELDAKYKTIAADADVKAALDKVNAAAPASTRATIGPSPDFTAAVAELKKWRGDVESEAIPMREEHGVHTVEAIINGQAIRMLVDTGATHITLPWETAEKLKVTPGEKDPTIQMKLANGAIIDGKKVTLKSVRVGRFTVNDVTCIVLQQGLPEPPTMLGSSFLSHFIVRLNQSKQELHLTEVNAPGKKPARAVQMEDPADKPAANKAPNKDEEDTKPQPQRGRSTVGPTAR
jgi:aspartyl protease family protein